MVSYTCFIAPTILDFYYFTTMFAGVSLKSKNNVPSLSMCLPWTQFNKEQVKYFQFIFVNGWSSLVGQPSLCITIVFLR